MLYRPFLTVKAIKPTHSDVLSYELVLQQYQPNVRTLIHRLLPFHLTRQVAQRAVSFDPDASFEKSGKIRFDIPLETLTFSEKLHATCESWLEAFINTAVMKANLDLGVQTQVPPSKRAAEREIARFKYLLGQYQQSLEKAVSQRVADQRLASLHSPAFLQAEPTADMPSDDPKLNHLFSLFLHLPRAILSLHQPATDTLIGILGMAVHIRSWREGIQKRCLNITEENLIDFRHFLWFDNVHHLLTDHRVRCYHPALVTLLGNLWVHNTLLALTSDEVVRAKLIRDFLRPTLKQVSDALSHPAANGIPSDAVTTAKRTIDFLRDSGDVAPDFFTQTAPIRQGCILLQLNVDMDTVFSARLKPFMSRLLNPKGWRDTGPYALDSPTIAVLPVFSWNLVELLFAQQVFQTGIGTSENDLRRRFTSLNDAMRDNVERMMTKNDAGIDVDSFYRLRSDASRFAYIATNTQYFFFDPLDPSISPAIKLFASHALHFLSDIQRLETLKPTADSAPAEWMHMISLTIQTSLGELSPYLYELHLRLRALLVIVSLNPDAEKDELLKKRFSGIQKRFEELGINIPKSMEGSAQDAPDEAASGTLSPWRTLSIGSGAIDPEEWQKIMDDLEILQTPQALTFTDFTQLSGEEATSTSAASNNSTEPPSPKRQCRRT